MKAKKRSGSEIKTTDLRTLVMTINGMKIERTKYYWTIFCEIRIVNIDYGTDFLEFCIVKQKIVVEVMVEYTIIQM